MKKNIVLAMFVLLSALCFAQAPQSFRYQAVVRYQDGTIVQNQMVSLRISILAESPVGSAVYAEWHRIATNEFGIANINVGEGTIVSGAFNQINWGDASYFLKTELDITGNQNFSFIGTSEILSVPYALYAENAVNVNDADADPENEIQNLDLDGDTISISLGNSIVLPYDGDTVTGNEIQILSIQGDTVFISQGNYIVLPFDDDTVIDNEIQILSIEGDTIYISQGNYIVLPFDEDFYSDNEIQALGFSNDTLYLENGGWVYLGQYFDNTDQQTLTLNGTTLSISNGNTVTFNEAVDLDGDPTNEIQIISITNDTIYLSQGGYIKLPEAFDWQYSSLIGAPTNISNFENDAGYLTEEIQGVGDVIAINNDAENQRISNVAAPEDPNDVATKGYVDNLISILENNGLTVIDFVASSQQKKINLDIEFTDLSTFNPDVWLWNFGDGTTSNLQNPLHSYSEAGLYTITLIAGNDYYKDTIVKENFISVFPEIGGSYAGGIIFYIDNLGNNGSVCTDLNLGGVAWGCDGNITGANSEQDGKSNTIAIVEYCGVGDYAAYICDTLTLNGYDDWYCPAIDQLEMICVNLHLQGLGNFSSSYYWSSTQSSMFFGGYTHYENAYYFDFANNVSANNYIRGATFIDVRAVRDF